MTVHPQIHNNPTRILKNYPAITFKPMFNMRAKTRERERERGTQNFMTQGERERDWGGGGGGGGGGSDGQTEKEKCINKPKDTGQFHYTPLPLSNRKERKNISHSY